MIALAQPALADQAVTVRGTDLPAGAGLAHVGCASPYDAGGTALQPFVGLGPGDAPLGERSLGFDPAAGAAGPVAYTASLAGVATASVAVDAASGTTGVAWVGYQAPADAGTSRVWFGRAPLSAPAGGWSRVSATGLTLDWSLHDSTTGAVVETGPSATVADFVSERGDGPGLYALAFGCDGAPFNVDAFRFGAPGDVTTYDFEGLATTTTMLGSAATVTAGDTLQLVGSLAATGGASIPHATAILERRDDQGAWQTVRVVDAGSRMAATIEPPVSGTYRWRFVGRPLAEASTSATYVVDVAAAVDARVAGDGRSVTGVVAPGRAGSRVVLRPVAGGDPVASATTGTGGRYSLPLAGVEAGRYVVAAPATDDNLRGESQVVVVEGGVQAEPQAPAPSSGPTQTPAPSAPSEPSAPSTAPSAAPSPQPVEPKPSPKPEQPQPSSQLSSAPSAPVTPAPQADPAPSDPPAASPSAPTVDATPSETP